MSETGDGRSSDGPEHPPTPQLSTTQESTLSPTAVQQESPSEAKACAAEPRCCRSAVARKIRSWLPRCDHAEELRLKSLAPQYDEAQHHTYLDHLVAAVKDPRNRNIALSGRYGTGKSSVLNRFQEIHEAKTLRLAISSLAPVGKLEVKEVTLTNRIQKEVLKQLVYSADSKTLRHSRFSQRGPLPWWKAAAESAAFVVILGVLLTLLRHLPAQVYDSGNHTVQQRTAVWVAVGVLLTLVLAVARTVTYNRFVVSGMSAAGATLSLSAPENTYFDEHLDEIVYFFDQEPKDFVIFEDLDRYDDPQIFQALRELNTMLNNSPKRRKQIEKHNNPLRFIYAMRDSLFQAIGEDTAEQTGDDAARAENIRANRTKFFEIVIPVVPFISHRTAREHLHNELQGAGIDIDRPLVELVAKHVTDMRLLLNIRNEYIVFAERLLASDQVAPKLSASHLFALVAYKNFHLDDFENIARRGSDLDRLYDFYRQLVAGSISDRGLRKRNLLAENEPPPAISALAGRLGRELAALGQALLEQHQNRDRMRLGFAVNSQQYSQDSITSIEFWEAVVEAGSIVVQGIMQPAYGGNVQPLVILSEHHLEGLFPDALAGRWIERNVEEARRAADRLDREIELIRGADFRHVYDDETLTLALPTGGKGQSGDLKQTSFRQFARTTLRSDLAQDLVAQGYIDQNFALYAAQFYGDFTGVDVATFIVQVVQANGRDFHYRFAGPESIANLIAEADTNFTSTISAYNIQVLDYLLVNDAPRADEVVRHITTKFGSDAQQFVTAFFTANGQRTRLASRMSHLKWYDVFVYLSSDSGVPADVRASLVNAALLAANPDAVYNVGTDFTNFILTNYASMAAFTEPQSAPEVEALVAILRRASARLPSLAMVDEKLKSVLVKHNLYELTADNLRSALNIEGEVTLDRISDNEVVRGYCQTYMTDYLNAVEADDDTQYSVRSSETLVAVLDGLRDAETIGRLTMTASRESCVPQLVVAPRHAWGALAGANLIRATVANLEAYRAEVGEIDENFGHVLIAVGRIEIGSDDEEDPSAVDKTAAAIAILNASKGIPLPEDRVRLVATMELEQQLQPTEITPEASDLFALLIEHELVSDDAVTFAHLHAGGWSAIEPAILASTNIRHFLSPEIVDSMIAPLFQNAAASSKIGGLVLQSLAQFVPTDDAATLRVAAQYAIDTNQALPFDQVRRITVICRDPELTVPLLEKAGVEASDLVNVLIELGGVYSNLANWVQNSFEVPHDAAHRALLITLQKAGICKFNKKPRKPYFIVRRP